MKNKYFKKLLLVSILSCTMAYTATSCADNSSVWNAPSSLTGTAQTQRLTRMDLQEWVQGFQVAFPFYQIELKSYEDKGPDQSLAVISVALGNPSGAESTWGEGMYLESLIKLDIEQGYKLENGVASIARINYKTEIQENSTAEFFELQDMIQNFLDKLQYNSMLIVRPDGELYAEANSTEAFEWKERHNYASIPSFTSRAQTYDNKKLMRFEVLVPLATIGSTRDEGKMVVQNLRVFNADRPIRDAVYQLNGDARIDIEKVQIVEEGSQTLVLNDIHYAEKSKVDNAGLLGSKFTVTFSGEESLLARMNDQTPATHRFNFVANGQIKNFHADSYVNLTRTMFNDPQAWIDDEESMAMVTEIFVHGPQIELEKVMLIIDGHQGEGSLKVAIPPLTESEKNMPFVLLALTKLEAAGDMRMPIEWFELVEPDKQVREQMIKSFLEEMDGYIEHKGNYLVSSFSYKDGNLLVNGKDIGLLN